MNNDISAGQWKQMRGDLKSWWGRLTDDELDLIGGHKDKLIGLVQERYGYARDHAVYEVEQRLKEFNAKTVVDGLESTSFYLREKNFEHLAKDVTALVRTYPIQFILIGVGLGYLLARRTR